MTGFEPISGRCQCGAVRFTVRGPAERLYHCHCSMCRRVHGAVFGTFAVVRRDRLTIDRGADNLVTYDSSPKLHRLFCRTCGCQLFNDSDDEPNLIWYTPGTVDGDPGNAPGMEMHIFVGSKLPWYRIADGLPQHHEFANP
ncbi:MAG: GFA family protein [Alphaproteobacteria bacterium]